MVIALLITVSLSQCTTVDIYLTDQMANDFAPISNGRNLKISETFNHPSLFSPLMMEDIDKPEDFFLILLFALDLRWEPLDFLALDFSLLHQSLLFKVKQIGKFTLSTGIEHSFFFNDVYQLPLGFTYKINRNFYTWLNAKPGLAYVNETVHCPDDSSVSVDVSVTGLTGGFSGGIGYIPPSGFFATLYFSQIFPVKFPDHIPTSACQDDIEVNVYHYYVIGAQVGWSFDFSKNQGE